MKIQERNNRSAQSAPFAPARWIILCACFVVLSFEVSIGADDKVKAKPNTDAAKDSSATQPSDNPFARAITFAQQRCVRIYGAGIGREHGYASGVIVSPDGHILTARGIYLASDRLRVAM